MSWMLMATSWAPQRSQPDMWVSQGLSPARNGLVFSYIACASLEIFWSQNLGLVL